GRLLGKIKLYGGPSDTFDPEWLDLALETADVIVSALNGHEARGQFRDANALLAALMESMPEAIGFVDVRGQCSRDHTLDWEQIREQAEADSVAKAARDSIARVDSLREGAI